jgi:hypothetical protein
LLNGIFDTYCNDVNIEEYQEEKEPELEDDNDFFVLKLEGMIEELKMEKLDENYAKEEKENIQDVEEERELIEKESKKLMNCVNCIKWSMVSKNTGKGRWVQATTETEKAGEIDQVRKIQVNQPKSWKRNLMRMRKKRAAQMEIKHWESTTNLLWEKLKPRSTWRKKFEKDDDVISKNWQIWWK